MNGNEFAEAFGEAWREAAQDADLQRAAAMSQSRWKIMDLRPEVQPEVFVGCPGSGGAFRRLEIRNIRAVGARVYIEVEEF